MVSFLVGEPERFKSEMNFLKISNSVCRKEACSLRAVSKASYLLLISLISNVLIKFAFYALFIRESVRIVFSINAL